MSLPRPFRLRAATPADAPALAHVHVTSWRETYAGLLPDDFLTRMTGEAMRERRGANWQQTLAGGQETVLVGEREGEVVAFASAGPPRDHPGADAELYTLYALREAQGLGLGRALLREVAARLGRTGTPLAGPVGTGREPCAGVVPPAGRTRGRGKNGPHSRRRTARGAAGVGRPAATTIGP